MIVDHKVTNENVFNRILENVGYMLTTAKTIFNRMIRHKGWRTTERPRQIHQRFQWVSGPKNRDLKTTLAVGESI